jgi:cytoskeletal protein RodZ
MRQTTFPGEELRLRREELGLSIEDVSQKVRIPEEFVDALERGDLIRLPAPCYVRGFLRSYCQFLALDPGRYQTCYELSLGLGSRFSNRKKRSPKPAEGSWLSEWITWTAVCAVLLLAWITYMTVVDPRVEETDGRVQAGTVQIVVPPESRAAGF